MQTTKAPRDAAQTGKPQVWRPHSVGHCRAFVSLYLGITGVSSCSSEMWQGSVEGISALDARCCSVVSRQLTSGTLMSFLFCLVLISNLYPRQTGSPLIFWVTLGKGLERFPFLWLVGNLFLEIPWVLGVSEIQSGGKLTKLHLQWKPVHQECFNQWSQWKQQELAGNKQQI